VTPSLPSTLPVSRNDNDDEIIVGRSIADTAGNAAAVAPVIRRVVDKFYSASALVLSVSVICWFLSTELNLAA